MLGPSLRMKKNMRVPSCGFPELTNTKQRIKCLVQGHNKMSLSATLEPKFTLYHGATALPCSRDVKLYN